jgi:hypothetical protein
MSQIESKPTILATLNSIPGCLADLRRRKEAEHEHRVLKVKTQIHFEVVQEMLDCIDGKITFRNDECEDSGLSWSIEVPKGKATLEELENFIVHETGLPFGSSYGGAGRFYSNAGSGVTDDGMVWASYSCGMDI